MNKDTGATIFSLMKSINYLVNQNLREKFCENGLTIPQLSVLAIVSKNSNRMKISEIGSILNISNSTVSGIIDRLEKQQYIKRVRSEEDRRVIFIEPDKRSKALYDEFHLKIEGYLDGILENSSSEEISKITEGLEILKNLLEIKANNN